ncbi:MAG: hypothetical protein PHU85_08570 [Phycisphaerae bacterium]|nr:hypothetical protein [Phycisphaerae bacterium]
MRFHQRSDPLAVLRMAGLFAMASFVRADDTDPQKEKLNAPSSGGQPRPMVIKLPIGPADAPKPAN